MSASPVTEYRLISRHLRRPLAWAPAPAPLLGRPDAARQIGCCDPGCDGFDDELAAEVLAASRRWLESRIAEPAQDTGADFAVEPWQRVARFRLICRHCRGVYFSVERRGL